MEYTGPAKLEFTQRFVDVYVTLTGDEYDPETGQCSWWEGSYSTDDQAGIREAFAAKDVVTMHLDDGRSGKVVITGISHGIRATGDFVGDGALPA